VIIFIIWVITILLERGLKGAKYKDIILLGLQRNNFDIKYASCNIEYEIPHELSAQSGGRIIFDISVCQLDFTEKRWHSHIWEKNY
jgi:hypothetical protein